MKRLVVVISGRGSNLGAIVAAIRQHAWPIDIVNVISNRPLAQGLETARAAGLPTTVLDHVGFADRAEFDAALADEIARGKPDLIALAGFMRILTPQFCARFAGRLVNIHPSLLPAFKGLNTHQQALEAGVAVHGCTVHLVTPDLDHGPIVAQGVVPVMPSDDTDLLADRVLEMEHRLYPMAIAALLSGRLSWASGRRHDSGRGEFSCDYAPCLLHPDL